MGARGRKPVSALTVVQNNPAIVSFMRRPEPPEELTDEEAHEWREIVGVMPAEHFMRANLPLLTQLCRHIIAARRVAQLLEQASTDPTIDRVIFVALLKQQSAESLAISRLLRSMRLTQQSVMRSETAKTKHPKGVMKNPWEDDEEDE